MSTYAMPVPAEPAQARPRTVYTVASGDLRPSANLAGWPTQLRLESDLTAAIGSLGWEVQRGHEHDDERGHGFIDSQRHGLAVFGTLPPDAPLAVVEGVWKSRPPVLAGLRSHRGPILVVANGN